MLHETRFIPPEFWIDEALIRRHGQFFKEIHQLLAARRLEGSVGIIGVREVDPIRRITDPDFLPVDSRLVNAFNWFQQVLLVYNSKKNTWGNPAGHIDLMDRSFWRALAREVTEETGYGSAHYLVTELLDVSVDSPGIIGVDPDRVLLLFKAEFQTDCPPPRVNDEEVTQALWLPPAEAFRRVTQRHREGLSHGEIFMIDYFLYNTRKIEDQIARAREDLVLTSL